MRERPDENCGDEIELKLQAKEPHLPKSIRAYIRRLKQEGKWDKAIELRNEIIRQRRTRVEIATSELNKTLVEIIREDDPLEEASDQVKAVWLLHTVGVLGTDTRIEETLSIVSSLPPELQQGLEEKLPSIRDEVKKFMPLAS